MSFGQNGSLININDIDKYCIYVDSLIEINHLVIVEYPDMSFCGGDLKGFYLNDSLIYLSSTVSIELIFRKLNVYFYGGKSIKIHLYEHFPNWDEYYLEFPNGEGEYGTDYTSMTYADATSNYYLIKPTVAQTLINDVFVEEKLNNEKHESHLKCIKNMIKELVSIIDE